MALVNVTGFQRARRLAAEKAEREAKVEAEQENATESQNESQEPLSPDDVDSLEIERVKELLTQMEIKFAHNTGEEKLREKLKDAIG